MMEIEKETDPGMDKSEEEIEKDED